MRGLTALKGTLEVLTPPGIMGEVSARHAGLAPRLIAPDPCRATNAEDTVAAAREMKRLGADLILFAGGDGTARDVHRAVGDSFPALGIPAGVKIFSAAFAIHPTAAGELARQFLTGEIRDLRLAEVLDLDEDAYRASRISPALYGYLMVPYRRRLIQGRKSPGPTDEKGTLESIAQDVVEQMQPGVAYIVGPGSTTRPILGCLGLEKTLVGVDIIVDRRLVAADAGEAAILRVLAEHPGNIIVTPIGGQGILFGRGNQPISPAVLRRVGRGGIVVVSLPQKIHALRGRPLLVDTGDAEVDRWLTGYLKVVTAYRERIVYRVST
jgi:predicted polyphosphate/ATP-dependent NAD kinase